ncbi:MAG TPA: DUF3035 domain-containing protein [Rhizomicrobium sp.]|jgi:hypothetical protein|nr:DUF3035 domain-containing protein [Rhizomicrobium sp.]
MQPRRILTLALLAGVAAALTGCDAIRQAAGQGKDAPDEFAVVTKAPLVIPPDFNLKPPAPGAAPANQIEPTQAAQSALFNTDPATVAASLPPTMSAGERYLLASAGVQNADPAIRQAIASDASGMRGSDESFTDSVLFWNAPTPAIGAVPVDADAEARRVDAARAGGAASAPPQAGTPSAPPSSDSNGDDDSGWLGHLWPF